MAKIKHITGDKTSTQVITGASTTTWQLDATATIVTDADSDYALTDYNESDNTSASGQPIIIAGDITADTIAMALTATHKVTINKGASLSGDVTGLQYHNESVAWQLTNSGSISGDNAVAHAVETGSARFTMTNTENGVIDGGQIGVNLWGASTLNNNGKISATAAVEVSRGALKLDNTGEISGESVAVVVSVYAKRASILNEKGGVIDSDGTALSLQGADAVVKNYGSITADVMAMTLTETMDIYNYKGGVIQSGNIGIKQTADDFTLNNAGKITATTAEALLLYGSDVDITNSGTIKGGSTGLSNTSGDGLSLDNSGSIIGVQNGVYSVGDNAEITNSGKISATYYGVQLLGEGSKLVNEADGVINGQSLPVWFGNTSGTTTFVNHGSVTGNKYNGISGADGVTVITNTGSITGSIYLGGGNDVFKNVGGTVSGTINLEAGSDTYIIDKSSLRVAESDAGNTGDIDTVKASVNFTLGLNIENLVLTGKANIKGVGNDLDNVITGNSGDNRLTGKGGADDFHFATGGGHDRITDFTHLTDQVDISDWAAIKNYSDLTKHHLTFTDDGALIKAGADELLLVGIDKTELSKADFIF